MMSADHFSDGRYKTTPPKDRERRTRQATVLLPVRPGGKPNPVKLHVTPVSTLMVQELLSLQLRFLGQRRGQAYSESKRPSHNLHITRLIPISDPHRKRIRHIRLYFGLSGKC